MAQVYETAGRFAARTAYNPAFVEAVKEIAGRRWDSANKVWTVGADQADALRALVEKFFGKPTSAPEPAKRVADFATVRDYAAYLEKRVQAHARTLPSTDNMAVAFFAEFDELASLEGKNEDPLFVKVWAGPKKYRDDLTLTAMLVPGAVVEQVLAFFDKQD